MEHSSLTQSVQTTSSVVLPDLDVVMHCRDVFRLTRDGRGLICGFLGPGAAGQPYDSVLVGVHMNAPQAGYMRSSELCLDRRCDGRILHEDRRVGAIRIGVLVGPNDSGPQ